MFRTELLTVATDNMLRKTDTVVLFDLACAK